MKRKIAVIVATAMILGNVSTSFAASFSDINNVPWEGAKTYINSAADMGLMVGDEDIRTGKKVFRANDKVTYCETTQLAYNVLKNNYKLQSTTDITKKWSSVLSGYNIPTWANESVSYALEYNILSLSDVAKFMKDSKTNNYATREGVAVIFGKALSATNTVNTGATLSFADKSSVAPTSVPYVDLLVRLNILVGDDENKFNAKNYINRAEMAVVTTKTNTVLNGSGNSGTPTPTPTPNPGTSTPTPSTVRGTVTKVEDVGGTYMVTINGPSGSVGFFGNSTTYVVKENSTEQMQFTQIKAGDIITIDYSGAMVNKITVNFINTANTTTDIVGKIDEISSDRIYVLKSSGGSAVNYKFASNVDITLNGSTARIKDLIDEFGDSTIDVTVTVNASGEAQKIVAKSTTDGITGKIISIDDDEIEVRRTSGGTKTYKFANNPKIQFNGSSTSISKTEDRMDDDTIYVTVYTNSSGKVTKINTSKKEFDSKDSDLKGTIDSLTSSVIKIEKNSSGTKSYDIADNATIRLDDEKAKIRDIQDAMDDDDVYVTLELNSSGKVDRIEASTEEDDDDDYDIEGIANDIDDDEISVKKDGSSSYKDYDLASKVTIKLDGKKADVDDIQDAIDDEDEVYVKLKLNNKDDVTTIIASTEEDSDTVRGEVTNIYSDEIKIRKSNGNSANYTFSSSIKITLDGSSNSDYKDIKKEMDNGKTVEVRLTLSSSSSKKVNKIVATTSGSSTSGPTTMGKAISAESGSIRIEESTGSILKTYTYADDVDFKLDGYTSNNKEVRDTINKGNKVVRVTLTLNSKEKVTKVDAKTSNYGEDTTITGVLNYIDAVSVSIYPSTTSSKYVSYSFSGNVVITLLNKDGTNAGNTYIAIQEYTKTTTSSALDVTVTLNSDEKVTRLVATKRA